LGEDWESAFNLIYLNRSLFLFLRFYLFICQRERKRTQAGGAADRAGRGRTSSLLSKEPDVELDPRTLGS